MADIDQAQAWKRFADELHINIDTPCDIVLHGGTRIRAAAHVKDFGGRSGMVVDPARTSNSYVEYLLQSLKAILQAKGKGSAQANINLATFENERFPFPPKQVQR